MIYVGSLNYKELEELGAPNSNHGLFTVSDATRIQTEHRTQPVLKATASTGKILHIPAL